MCYVGAPAAAQLNRSSCEFDSGGVRCRGWFYRPDSEPPYACVVMAHGFGAAPDGPLGHVARRFAAAGIAGFAFDYRGFGASDGEPRGVLNVRRALEDWATAIAYVRSRSDIDSSRVGLWGSSLSGGEVLAVAARDRRIAAAVAQVPYCDGWAAARAAGVMRNLRMLPAVARDLVRAAARRPPYLIDAIDSSPARAAIKGLPPELLDQILGPANLRPNQTAARSLLEMYRFRPIYRAAEIRCPLLLVLSYDDDLAPPGPAMRAAQQLTHIELALFHARHFDVYAGETRERVLRTELAFMNHHFDRRRRSEPETAAREPAPSQ